MYTVKFWRDYYNERREHREIVNYREKKSVAIAHGKRLVEELGYDRAIVFETGSGKFIEMFERK